MEAELFLLYWQNCDRIGPVIEGKSRLDVETIVSSSSRIAFAFIRARTNVPRNERTVFYQEFRTNQFVITVIIPRHTLTFSRGVSILISGHISTRFF